MIMPIALTLTTLPNCIAKGSVKFNIEVIKSTEVLHYCYTLKTATISQPDYEDLLDMIETALSKKYKFPRYISAADINSSGRKSSRQILIDIYWKLPKTSFEIIKEAGMERVDKTKSQILTDQSLIDLRASKVIRKQAKESDSKEWEIVNDITTTLREIFYEYSKIKKRKLREKKMREEGRVVKKEEEEKSYDDFEK